MKLGNVEVGDELDSSGELEVYTRRPAAWLTKGMAIKLVEHLQHVFVLPTKVEVKTVTEYRHEKVGDRK